MNNLSNRPLGDLLIENGKITIEQLQQALDEQKRTLKRIGEVLTTLGMVSEEDITEVRSIQLDVAYTNLEDYEFNPEVVALVSESVARTYMLIPVAMVDDKLKVAMANPLDIEAIDLVQFGTKCRVEPSLATEWRIVEAINKQYGEYACDDLLQCMGQAAGNVEVASIPEAEDLKDDLNEMKRQSHRAPIVRMVNLFLAQAVRKKASDIHIEPRRNNVDIRYRVDGELQLAKTIPKALQPAIASRIKIMSELDIAERRMPQDGRITVNIDGRGIDLRVSTSPTLYGERIVLRILDRTKGVIPLEDLGYSAKDLEHFKSLIARPHGIILVTGPTGSGKTTTLYAGLAMIRAENINIMTVEDPIEYELDGVNQTNVHHKIGLTFARQLRAILRQDPDVVLVGEIRDTETADVAFRAALTGHLVLSTLHANDAPSAITRLLDMDVEPFLVSSAIVGVVAQRLARVLCPKCKEQYEAQDHEKIILGLPLGQKVILHRAVGCSECDNSGYKGRTCISEIMSMNEHIRRLALSKASAVDIQQAAMNAGMITMRQDGVSKVLDGVTTIEELERKIFVQSEMFELDKAA